MPEYQNYNNTENITVEDTAQADSKKAIAKIETIPKVETKVETEEKNPMDKIMNLTKLTDFYEITMANGYFANGNSLEVGRASTQAVVVSSIVILIFNLILTQLLLT